VRAQLESNLRRISKDVENLLRSNFGAVKLIKEWEIFEKERHMSVALFPKELDVVGQCC
jgi:hypothetical protein